MQDTKGATSHLCPIFHQKMGLGEGKGGEEGGGISEDLLEQERGVGEVRRWSVGEEEAAARVSEEGGGLGKPPKKKC